MKDKLTTKQMMRHFNKSRQTIVNWTKTGCPYEVERIPGHNGKRLVFHLPDVERWLLTRLSR